MLKHLKLNTRKSARCFVYYFSWLLLKAFYFKYLTNNVVVLTKRDGLLKMQDVYRKDAKLGDPRSLNKQLEEVAQELDRLKQELNKYEVRNCSEPLCA